MPLSEVILESTTVESLIGELKTDVDPTGGAAPEFSLTTGLRTDPATWVAGSWVVGSYVSKTWRVDARSPLIGAGQALDVTEGTVYNLWVRWVINTQTPVVLLGVVRVL